MSRKRGIFDNYLEAEWPQIRKGGRSRFVWRHRVLPFGVPGGFFAILWILRRDGVSMSELLTGRALWLAYFAMAVMIVTAYVFARIEWSEREDKHLKRRPDDPDIE